MCAFKETHYNTCIDSQLSFGRILKNSFSTSDKRIIEINVPITIFFWIDSTEQKFILKLGFNLFFSHSFHSAFGIDRFCRYWFESRKITIKCCRQLFRSLFSPRSKRVRVKTRYIYRKLQCYLIHKWTKPIESTKQLHCLQSIRLLTAIKFVAVFFLVWGSNEKRLLFVWCVCVCCLFLLYVSLDSYHFNDHCHWTSCIPWTVH